MSVINNTTLSFVVGLVDIIAMKHCPSSKEIYTLEGRFGNNYRNKYD